MSAQPSEKKSIVRWIKPEYEGKPGLEPCRMKYGVTLWLKDGVIVAVEMEVDA